MKTLRLISYYHAQGQISKSADLSNELGMLQELDRIKTLNQKQLPKDARDRILNTLDPNKPVHISKLTEACNVTQTAIKTLLFEMEIEGWLTECRTNKFILA